MEYTPKIKLKSRVSYYTVTHTQYLPDKEITKLFTAQQVEVVDFDCEPDDTKYYWTVHVWEDCMIDKKPVLVKES